VSKETNINGVGTKGAQCSSTEKVIAGGYSFEPLMSGTGGSNIGPDALIIKNAPDSAGHSWVVQYKGFPSGTILVYAICATVPEDTHSSP
jgi:hypothetical protein